MQCNTQQIFKSQCQISKFELSPKSESSKEILSSVRLFLSDKNTRRAIENVMENSNDNKRPGKIVGITDIFITLYEKGQFLSAHNDENSGSLAIVLSLSKNWKSSYGGNLDFFCLVSAHTYPNTINKFYITNLF